MIIGTVWDGSEYTAPDTQFANTIPEQATSVVFTDEVAPKGITTTDLTVAKDGDVVGWLDGTTWKVSTQDPNKAVTFNENCTGMFSGVNGNNQLKSISFDNIDTSKVTDMQAMFANCTNLTSLNLSSFNTSKVTDMQAMFISCSNLSSLDLSSFNTSKVTDMLGMFYGCSSLMSLDLSGFDTSNVTNMQAMFQECSNLTSLNVSSFDTSKIEEMYGMFYSCSNLNTLDLSSFDTSNVTDMSLMFYDCSSLETVKAHSQTDINNFKTKNTDVNPSVKFILA